jgi:hypothetical protein
MASVGVLSLKYPEISVKLLKKSLRIGWFYVSKSNNWYKKV